MPARRGKSQAKRNTSNGTPGWVWLIAGLVLGAAVFFIVPDLMKKDGDNFLRPKPNPDARPAPVTSDDEGVVTPSGGETPAPATPAATASKPAPEKPTQYDFYTLLPGREVQMSDAELAASARAEEQRKAKEVAAAQAKAAKDAAANPPATSADAAALARQQPTPLDEMTKTPSATPTQTSVAAAAASNAVASAAGDVNYILQAGSFSASGDAEAVKAKIAMLGLSARVESGDSAGKTVYRVRMGPYGTASELAEAKQKLSGSGLPAMAIKAR
ncbi:MAG: SPOR domain-containing protein [Pseudoxanthomonas sp.]|jgi:cell division protein FtsN